MESYSTTLTDTENSFSIQELKFLLSSILEHHANTRFRYLLEGGIWTEHYMRVLLVTGKGAVLYDEVKNKVTSIKSLRDITQVELDKTYKSYQSKYHYKILAG